MTRGSTSSIRLNAPVPSNRRADADMRQETDQPRDKAVCRSCPDEMLAPSSLSALVRATFRTVCTEQNSEKRQRT